MKIEEKAKAYDEMVQRVKELHETGNFLTKKQMEIICPELAESEDERIRKAILGLTYVDGIEPILEKCSITKQEIRAWLEKQKEPHYTKRNALFDKCVENCDPEVMKEVSDKVDEMLGKEQKPAEWSEEDDRKRLACIDTINEVIDYELDRWEDYNPGKPYRPITKYDEQIDWLKSLRPSWKPSEEQMSMLLAVINDPNNAGSESCHLALISIYEQLQN